MAFSTTSLRVRIYISFKSLLWSNFILTAISLMLTIIVVSYLGAFILIRIKQGLTTKIDFYARDTEEQYPLKHVSYVKLCVGGYIGDNCHIDYHTQSAADSASSSRFQNCLVWCGTLANYSPASFLSPVSSKSWAVCCRICQYILNI